MFEFACKKAYCRYTLDHQKGICLVTGWQPNDNQLATERQPNDNQLATEESIGKDSKGDDSKNVGRKAYSNREFLQSQLEEA